MTARNDLVNSYVASRLTAVRTGLERDIAEPRERSRMMIIGVGPGRGRRRGSRNKCGAKSRTVPAKYKRSDGMPFYG